MINGIGKKINMENMPTAEVKRGGNLKSEKEDREYRIDKAVNNRADANDKKEEKIDTQEAVNRVENLAKHFNRKIHLEVEEDLDMIIVKVVDGETDEVIRQIPPEELVELSKNAKNLKGLLINTEG